MELIYECPEEYINAKPGREYRNIQSVTYHSSITDTDRPVNVILPKDYTTDKKYPVLYVLHGFFGNEGTMLKEENSYIPELIGNMNDAGEAKEVILVYPNIYVTANPDLAPGFTLESIEPYNIFREELIDELDPFIQANFSVAKGAENRAVFGFSMGGRQAIYTGLTRADFAEYIAAAAPAPGLIYAKDWAMEHPGMFERENLRPQQPDYSLKLLMLARGSKDSVVGKFPIDIHDALEENGVDHIWYEVPDFEHGEKIVQSVVYNLMRMWK